MPAARFLPPALLGLALAACAPAPAPAKPAPPPAPPPAASDRCDDLSTCEASCRSGKGEHCVAAARHMRESPTETTLERLVDVLRRACEAGKGESCSKLAVVLESAPSLQEDREKVRGLRVRSCELGYGPACLAAAGLPEGAKAVSNSEAVARILAVRAKLEAACEAHQGASCAVAAVLYLGVGGAPEPARVRALQQRALDEMEAACLHGAAPECVSGALEMLSTHDPDVTRLSHLLEEGCKHDEGEACVILGKGAEAAAPADRATLLQRGCDLGREEGCFALAKIQREMASEAAKAFAGTVTRETGLRLARAHCDLGESSGCDALAVALAEGAVKPAEMERTAAYLEKICERGSVLTCKGLWQARTSGPEALRDPERAARLAKRLCDVGPFTCPDPQRRKIP